MLALAINSSGRIARPSVAMGPVRQFIVVGNMRSLSSAASTTKVVTKQHDPSHFVKDETGMSPFVREQRRQKRLRPEKFATTPVLYAVRKGREVGIFEGWEKAKGKVLGFPGAHFKPFKSLKRAQAWLAAEESSLKASERPTPKKPADETQVAQPTTLQLNFTTATQNSANGFPDKIGLGWVLRKMPTNETVLAGCDVFDLAKWKQDHKETDSFKPVLSRELPMLAALNQALNETTKYYKVNEAVVEPSGKQGAEEKESAPETSPVAPSAPKKLPLPLVIKSDHSYTVGLLSGTNPLLTEFAEEVTAAKDKVLLISAQSEVAKVEGSDNLLASVLAKIAISRKAPRLVIEGKEKRLTMKDLKAFFVESQ